MPSPVGHALAGLAAARFFGGGIRQNWPYVLLASLADLDIAAAVARDSSVNYAHRTSHSIGAAVAAGVASGAAAWLVGGRFTTTATKGTTAYATHLILDYFGKEAESGLPLFWPFSSRRYSANRPFFRTIYSSRDHFVLGLFSRRNLNRILREIAIVSPALVAAHLLRRGSRRPAG